MTGQFSELPDENYELPTSSDEVTFDDDFDFDAALLAMSEQQARIDLETEIIDELVAELMDIADAHYLVPLKSQLLNEGREPNDYDRQRMNVEKNIFEAVVTIQIAYTRDLRLGVEINLSEYTLIKKQYIADLFVQGELQFENDPWFNFINDYLPGEAFNPKEEADQRIVADALVAYLDEDNSVNIAYARKLAELLRDHGLMDNDELNIEHDLFADIAELLPYALRSSVESEAAIDQLCRENGLGTRFAAELKLLVRAYVVEMGRVKSKE